MAGGQTAAPAPDAPPSPALPANPTPALAAPAATSIPSPIMDIINSAKVTDTGANDGVSPAIVRAEVMLDRVHASPGVIDGRDGENFVHAIEIYEKAKGLRATKGLGDKVWSSLLAESGGPVLMEYVLTDQDVEGPFFPNLPKDYGELAKLKTIGYRNPSQKIGAMFHMGENLLTALNPGVDLSKAGTKILVADVKPQPIDGTLKTIVVDKKKSQVLGYDRKGHVLVAYPATIGSRELPSPSGTYKVKGVAYNPIYYYDPDKNFVQGDNQEKLKLPPGPNNPVGSVFIALTKPSYGLHGTPSPDPSHARPGYSRNGLLM
jgi:lipoprotein-anchoring transpeptidase ErfK/SrfK